MRSIWLGVHNRSVKTQLRLWQVGDSKYVEPVKDAQVFKLFTVNTVNKTMPLYHMPVAVRVQVIVKIKPITTTMLPL